MIKDFRVKCNGEYMRIALDRWSTIISVKNLLSVTIDTVESSAEGVSERRYAICFEYKDVEGLHYVRPPIEKFATEYETSAMAVLENLLLVIGNAILRVDEDPPRQNSTSNYEDKSREHA